MFIPSRTRCPDIFEMHSSQAELRTGPPTCIGRFSRPLVYASLFFASFPSRRLSDAQGTPTILEVLTAAKRVIDRSLDSDHLGEFSIFREGVSRDFAKIPWGFLRTIIYQCAVI